MTALRCYIEQKIISPKASAPELLASVMPLAKMAFISNIMVLQSSFLVVMNGKSLTYLVAAKTREFA